MTNSRIDNKDSFCLRYAGELQSAKVPGGVPLGVLDVQQTAVLEDIDDAVRSALENPIGRDGPVYKGWGQGETVAILVSDSYRYTGVEHVLPVLVECLDNAGVRSSDITFVFATGTHRGPTEHEQRQILGNEIRERFPGQMVVHDPDDRSNLVHVGDTARGTRVELNRRVIECDHVIATGAVVLHYFAGYGGGRKSIIPGIASRATIAQNHALNLDVAHDRLNPDARIGVMDGNPISEDMLEAAAMTGVDAIFNTVLDQNSRIAAVFAGHYDAAHRAAARFADTLFAVPVREKADLVIASAGDAKNFVQSHKALHNAYQAVKPNGRIVLAAECPEGLGAEQFEQWLRLEDPKRVYAALRERSEVNGQTAVSTLEKGPLTIMVTSMSEARVRLTKARKAPALQSAVDAACAELRDAGIRNPSFYVMPAAAHTVPFPKQT